MTKLELVSSYEEPVIERTSLEEGSLLDKFSDKVHEAIKANILCDAVLITQLSENGKCNFGHLVDESLGKDSTIVLRMVSTYLTFCTVKTIADDFEDNTSFSDYKCVDKSPEEHYQYALKDISETFNNNPIVNEAMGILYEAFKNKDFLNVYIGFTGVVKKDRLPVVAGWFGKDINQGEYIKLVANVSGEILSKQLDDHKPLIPAFKNMLKIYGMGEPEPNKRRPKKTSRTKRWW